MSQSNLSVSALKKYLKDCPKEVLIDDISELFKRFPAVKDYYQVKLSPGDDSQVLDKYKKAIEKEFFPARGIGKASLSAARKAVTEYKKVCKTPIGLADLMLFYVEQGVKFTNAYGDIDERFYNSMESMYAKAVEHIVKTQLQDKFEDRCRKIVKDTSGIGWGFHDMLSEIYEEAFGEGEQD